MSMSATTTWVLPVVRSQARSASVTRSPYCAGNRVSLRVVPSTTPNDTLFPAQYGLRVTEADRAWDLTTGSTQVVVADIDIAPDYTHPDLYKNIWVNQAEIPAAIRTQLQDVDADGLITFWDLNES